MKKEGRALMDGASTSGENRKSLKRESLGNVQKSIVDEHEMLFENNLETDEQQNETVGQLDDSGTSEQQKKKIFEGFEIIQKCVRNCVNDWKFN